MFPSSESGQRKQYMYMYTVYNFSLPIVQWIYQNANMHTCTCIFTDLGQVSDRYIKHDPLVPAWVLVYGDFSGELGVA